MEWVYDFEDVFVKIVMIIVFSTVLSVILFFGVGILPEGLYMISRTIPG